MKILKDKDFSNSTLDYLSCFASEDIILDINNINKSVGKLCSHANTCKFRRDGCSINTCFHTHTCEFFCQKYVDKQYIKYDNENHQNYLNEAISAKKEKRLRR